MITKPCCPPPVPPAYPYNRPARDSYSFCVCGKVPENPSIKYPTSGSFVGSAFALKDTNPYLIDTTYTNYGQVVCYSESVYTQITQRTDPSCINLAARFDLTDTTLNNTVRTDFLEKYISRKYSSLFGVLPIIKTSLKFKVYYTIRDVDGGVTHEGVAVSTVLDNSFHFTDIRDWFVQSARGVIIENIPAMTYQGLYTITIDRVEAYVSIIDTKSHLQDGLNPFYSFTDNNMKMVLQHDIIESTTADEEILIAMCDVNKSFDYQANVTTRLRMTFVAFTSIPIAVGDTSGIWESLNEPTEEIITQLRNEVSACEDEIKSLHEIIEQQSLLIQKQAGQIELNKENLIALTARVTTLEANGESYDARLDDHESRITALEAIPLATLSYKSGTKFVKGQLTWRNHGELYQVTRDYVATGNFTSDIANGYLVKLSENASDITALTTRINEVESTVGTQAETIEEIQGTVAENFEGVSNLTSAVSDITTRLDTVAENVTTNSTNIESINGTVAGHTTTITDHETRISALEETP